jgi:hypothetical protein
MNWIEVKEIEADWFDHLRTTDDEDLYIETLQYWRRIMNHPGLNPYVASMLDEVIQLFTALEPKRIAEHEPLRLLLDEIIDAHPDWDAPVPPINGLDPNPEYFRSIQSAKDFLDGKNPLLALLNSEDGTPELAIIDILHSRLAQYIHNTQKDDSPPIEPETSLVHKLRKIRESHLYQQREITNQLRPSGGLAAFRIVQLISAINPAPMLPDTFMEYLQSYHSLSAAVQNWKDVHDTVYKSAPSDPSRINTLRKDLNRFHVDIRTRIGTTQTAIQLFNWFKSRCEWYDRNRLNELVAKTTFKENTLMDELARAVFDQGLIVWMRHRFGVLEPDLIAQHPTGVVAEGKAVTSNLPYEAVLKGIAQLLSYANTIDPVITRLHDLFYVIFRISGPQYMLPEVISLPNNHRWVIHPIYIDIGTSSVSGRQQRTVCTISPEDIEKYWEQQAHK